MAATLGRIEFDGTKDDWPQYVERLEHFFVTNGIDTAEKKRAVFLSVHNTSASPVDQGGSKSVPTCYRCGARGHAVANCRVDKNVVCHHCGKRGHLQRICKDRKKSSPSKTRRVSNRSNRRKLRTVGRVGDEERKAKVRARRMSK